MEGRCATVDEFRPLKRALHLCSEVRVVLLDALGKPSG